MNHRASVAVVLVLVAGGCSRDPSPPVATASAGSARADAGPADSSPRAILPSRAPMTIDPGSFQRFGCATDAMPPHIAAGTATVTWRPQGGGAFSYRNVPARCGAAFPGQMVGEARTRPGDGVEFVVCMPDERRLDIGFLRRAPVPPGVQDLAHTESLVRLRIGLDRFVNVVSAAATQDPIARLTFGPRLRSATGSARLGRAGSQVVEGIVEFEILCGPAREAAAGIGSRSGP